MYISFDLTAKSNGIISSVSGYLIIIVSKSFSIFLLPINEFKILSSTLYFSAYLYIFSLCTRLLVINYCNQHIYLQS